MARRIVYLDLNHLIELAKQEKAGDDDRLNRIKALAVLENTIFPITAAHIMEIASIGKEKQRSDLSGIIDSISRGYVLRSHYDMMYLEVAGAIAKYYRQQFHGNLRDIIVQRGYAQAFGDVNVDFTPWRSIDPEKSKAVEALFWNAVLGKGALDHLFANHYPKVAENGPEHTALKTAVANDRQTLAGKTIKEKEDECIKGLVQDIARNVMKAFGDLGLSKAEIDANPPKAFWELPALRSLPAHDVWSLMLTYLYHDPNREVKVNHTYDVAHLAVAIPYCDVVVCDKEMEHIIKLHKLDKKYGTKVFSSLDEALDYLESTPAT